MLNKKSRFDELIDIGIALNSEKNLDRLLEKIVTEARRFTNADAGSLYLREGDQIRFVVSQNDTLRRRSGQKQVKQNYLTFTLPISTSNIAGYVAATGEILHIDDVYELSEDVPFKFNRSFDEKSNYRSKSMLVVPMLDVENDVVGVIQLINALDKRGETVPFNMKYEKLAVSLASQAAVAVRMAQLREELKSSQLEMIHRLSISAEFRDEDTALHITRMSKYCQIIARGMGLSDEKAEEILFTSPMHDIGKLGVPDAILLKPGKLTDEEFDEMRKHTIYGAKILANSKHEIIQQAETVALTHHEKWNGKGYPNGLSGDSIPIEGRICALADVFDALSSKRCYKPAFPLKKVEKILQEDTGTHFDPQVTRAFFANYDKIMEVFQQYKEV